MDIALKVDELADLYALKTLYDFLVQRGYNAGFDMVHKQRYLEIAGDAPLGNNGRINVGVYSDSSDDRGDLAVDIAILKNCAAPLSMQEKDALRQKHGIEKPAVVIGYADNNVDNIVRSLMDEAHIYIFGHYREPKHPNVHMIKGYGMLKEYFAVADASIFADCLKPHPKPLHNIVEATENSALFIVTPLNTYQYGYRQLRSAGCIKECADEQNLIAKAKEALANPISLQARAEHIERTRAAYLPVILSHIDNFLSGSEPLESDLIVYDDGFIMLLHPESQWESIPRYVRFVADSEFRQSFFKHTFP